MTKKSITVQHGEWDKIWACDGQLQRYIHEPMGGWEKTMIGCVDGKMDGCLNEWMDWWMDENEALNGWIDKMDK